MPVPRSSTAQSKPAAAKQAKRSENKPGAAPKQRPTSRRGRGKAAQMLREIQLDAEALSVQLERLRHRFP